MALDPKAVAEGMRKLEKAADLQRSIDDFATSLLGKTAEVLDLIEEGRGLLAGTHILDALGNTIPKED